ncbi:hypothetical protein [Sessilibacter corallicola]|uniref:hypothetical protein n=1 Tax=Sessilibacter corallicola TaxID=2904075 RepID=UPI001E5DABF1|nr:hypothetical protein [Sessilibacter corallicola]MCE2029060.1 hypothetical protein [Sessilibacter corallicola]
MDLKNSLWTSFIKTIENEKTIYRGAIGFGAVTPEPLAAFYKFLDLTENSEEYFVSGLNDDRPIVVGYCLFGLFEINSNVIGAVDLELLANDEIIKWQFGSIRCVGTLTDFYQQLLYEKNKGKTYHFRDKAVEKIVRRVMSDFSIKNKKSKWNG